MPPKWAKLCVLLLVPSMSGLKRAVCLMLECVVT